MTRNHNIKLARNLRRNSSDAEKILWFYLRKRCLKNYRFRRQHPIGKYIVDFFCIKARVIVELDGSQHLESEERDARRDNWLMDRGYKVLRFYNNEFLNNREKVLETIVRACEENHPLPVFDHLPPDGEGLK